MDEGWHKLTSDNMPDPLKWVIYIRNDGEVMEGFVDDSDIGEYKTCVKWWIYPPTGYEV